MIMPVQIPAVWVYTTSSGYNAPRAAGYASFLTPEQQARVERIRQARLLFDGRHRQYFLDEGRTQFDFPPLLVANRPIQPYWTYPALGLIAQKITDLLFGEEPLLRTPIPAQQDALSALIERSNVHQVFAGSALDGAYEAEAFIEACVYQGQVYLQGVPADEIFPIGPLRPGGQYDKYCRYALKNVGTQSVPMVLLLEVTYSVGRIDRVLWQISAEGKKERRLQLSEWTKDELPMPESPLSGIGMGGMGSGGNYSGPIGVGEMATLAPLAPGDYSEPFNLEDTTLTGIDRNTITWIPNKITRGQAISDYDGAIDLQDKLNASMTQLARVFAKHADPKLAIPDDMFDDQGNFRANYDAVSFSEKDKIPTYITWNAEVKGAMDDREFALINLLVVTETSPVLLGLREGAHNDAYKKVKVQAQTSLKKAARKAVIWKPAIRRAVSVAQDLENTIPGIRYDRGPIGVTMNDGIPLDELDEANRIAILVAAKVMSRRRAVEAQLGDPAAVEAELKELDEEAEEAAAQATPSILFGESGEQGLAPAPHGPANPQENISAAAGDAEKSDEEMAVAA
jgi:hypothetical protein